MPTATFYSTADTHVSDLATGTNYGTATRMYDGYIAAADRRNCYLFLNFPLPRMVSCSAATLVRYLREDGTSTTLTETANVVLATWAETTITYASMPAVHANTLGTLSLPSGTGSKTMNLDTTETVRMSQLGFGMKVSSNGSITSQYDGWDTREYGSTAVYITATYVSAGSGVIFFSQARSFLNDLRAGLIPPYRLRARWAEALQI